MFEEFNLNKDLGLMSYLPYYWKDIKEMIELQEVLGLEVKDLQAKLKDLFSQCFIETATWGLDLWEKELGLKTNYKNSYTHRREMIKAKCRSAGTTTKEMIENVARAFSNGEVEVIEYNKEYYFSIKFVGTKGIPSNMNGLKHTLNEIKPAHLGIEYIFTQMTWDEFDNYNKTWNMWDSLNLTWDEFNVYNG